MRSSIVSCEVRRQDAQQVVSARGGAALEEQPGGLQIIKRGDAFQQPVLVSALSLELACNEIFMTKGGSDVWRGDKPLEERGLVVLGTPIGHPHFIAAWAAQRMRTEKELLHQLPLLPDLQCAWLLLAMCASPRANHALRTVPPQAVASYAQAHDAAIWETLELCLGGIAEADVAHAQHVATLPAALGGLGLRSAIRTAPAAYWAAWADALPALYKRSPAFAEACTRLLATDGGCAPSLRSAVEARELLQAEGWHECPSWEAVGAGARPPRLTDQGLGDWPHGWQCCASRIRTSYFRERTLLPSLSPSACALLRSQSGPQAGAWLTAIPSEPACALPPQAMLLALRRRLRLPLPLCASRCGPPGCGGEVDAFGDHALACTRTGLIARRAKIVERAWVRVAREAVGPDGQVVPQQWLAHTTAPNVRSDDRRRLDLVVYGATPLGGALCCDATLVSLLTRTGLPQPCAAAHDGAALRVAERRKNAAYPELNSGPQQLVVLGSEVGGRWNGPVRTSWSETSSVSEPSELRQPCEAPLRRHGPGVGGPCWPCRCNTLSRARPSGQLGPRLSTRANSRPQSWNACSTLLTQQGRAACRYAACRCL